MTFLAVGMFTLLALIAALQALWGFGMRWPARSERDLIALVIGTRGRTRMPGFWACAIAALAIFAAACIALLLVDALDVWIPATATTAGALLAIAIFAARGCAGFLPAWRRIFSLQPFARYDQRYYSPLCLLVAVAYVVLLINR